MPTKVNTQTADIIAAILASDADHDKQAASALDGHIKAQLLATTVIAPLYRVRNEGHIASQTGPVKNRKPLSMPAFIAGLKRDAENQGTEWNVKDYKVARAVAFAAHDAVCKTAYLAKCKRDDELALWTTYVTFVNGWGKGWYNADGSLTTKGKNARKSDGTSASAERKMRDLGTGDHITSIVEDEELQGENDEETTVNVGRWLLMVEHDLHRQILEWFADNVTDDEVAEMIKSAVSDAIRKAKAS